MSSAPPSFPSSWLITRIRSRLVPWTRWLRLSNSRKSRHPPTAFPIHLAYRRMPVPRPWMPSVVRMIHSDLLERMIHSWARHPRQPVWRKNWTTPILFDRSTSIQHMSWSKNRWIIARKRPVPICSVAVTSLPLLLRLPLGRNRPHLGNQRDKFHLNRVHRLSTICSIFSADHLFFNCVSRRRSIYTYSFFDYLCCL